MQQDTNHARASNYYWTFSLTQCAQGQGTELHFSLGCCFLNEARNQVNILTPFLNRHYGVKMLSQFSPMRHIQFPVIYCDNSPFGIMTLITPCKWGGIMRTSGSGQKLDYHTYLVSFIPTVLQLPKENADNSKSLIFRHF